MRQIVILIALTASLMLSGAHSLMAQISPSSQTSVGGQAPIDPTQTCDRYYVDPNNGSDGNTGLSATRAFQTITHAISVASLSTTDSVIMLLPGIYSQVTNSESFPLFPHHGISIQGTNALNTVLDAGGSSDCFVLFPTGIGTDFDGTYFDGFSVKFAINAFYLPEEGVGMKPTISNVCLIDNQVGVLMEAIDLEGDTSPYDTDGNDYIEHRPRLVNMTFVDNGVGIRDVVIPAFPATDDFGEADPAIANCLFVGNGLDLDGCDASDVKNDSDISSNIFCTASTRIKPGRFSPIGWELPFNCGAATADVFINPVTCDYRLKPTIGGPAFTYLVDQGIDRLDNLSYHMGLTMIKPNGSCGQKIWDADMEGFCNDRMVGSGHDIGADELGELIVSGYRLATTSFAPGAVAEVWVTPAAGMPNQVYSPARTWNERQNLGYLKWLSSSTPGARPRGTSAPSVSGSSSGLACIANSGLTVGPVGQSFTIGTPVSVPAFALSPTSRINEQYTVLVPGAGRFITNLQSYIVE